MMTEEYPNSQSLPFHTLSPEESLSALKSSREGLSHGEAAARLEMYGPNTLVESARRTLFHRIWDQLKNPMVLVLIAAGIISGIAGGHITDMLIIFAVVVLNVVLGVLQEGKAEKALESLRAMSSPSAKVRRNGSRLIVPVSEVVPGDIVELEAGDFVCADMRLIEVASLRIEEAALTGESVAAEKSADSLPDENIVLGDRINMAYSGTGVVYGRGTGVVTATGMQTEMGKIAASIATAAEPQTPIQKKLTELSKWLSILVLVICAVVFAATLIRQGTSETIEAFLLSVSLAVAAIPEGLPAVVTIVMALGVQRMASKNAIIRKLPAVETLGCTQVICSDKTGTLTQNKMTVVKAYANDTFLGSDAPLTSDGLELLVEALVFCNDSGKSTDEDGQVVYLGDPTETALLAYADKLGYPSDKRLDAAPRVAELPFDSERKLMSTYHRRNNKYIHFVKGAPDVILNRCNRVLINDQIVPLDRTIAERIEQANNEMASQALRVLAAAMNVYDELPRSYAESENDLVFIGLVGMIDPPRAEVKQSVEVCLRAGMRPIMITGDHKTTAIAIAKQLGILTDDAEAISGAELDRIPDEVFFDTVDRYSVYARVSPEHKVRIVEAWQRRGKVVSMTGDGVNDAPALKRADIGVGMGISGTDVTKNVADMVLTDDNFTTIVAAVEEGRKIYSNVRKCIHYLLSANLSEVLTVLTATLLGFTNFLHTIHILWINLVSDTFPSLGLGLENAESDSMEKPPRDAKEGIFANGVGVSIIYQGIVLAALTMAAYLLGRNASPETATTMAFCTLTFSQLFHSMNVRSFDKSLFEIGFHTNKYVIGAVLLSIVLTILIVQVPGLNDVFRLTALNGLQWFQVALLSAAILPVVELVKYIIKKVKRG